MTSQEYISALNQYKIMPIVESWMEQVDTERNIHEFIDEDFLTSHLSISNKHDLNWMKVFNSKVVLSNDFIVSYIEFVDWKWLTRALDETLLKRYSVRVVQWNAQLYGRPRTIDFLVENKKKFDWNFVSQCPPYWFNDLHFEIFGSCMNWTHLTKFVMNMNESLIIQYANLIDWDWITVNGIRDETFAKHFIARIDWNNPNLDSRCLSTEFLFNMRKKFQCDTQENDYIQIGATITNTFAEKYQYNIDWMELSKKGLITNKMKQIGVV